MCYRALIQRWMRVLSTVVKVDPIVPSRGFVKVEFEREIDCRLTSVSRTQQKGKHISCMDAGRRPNAGSTIVHAYGMALVLWIPRPLHGRCCCRPVLSHLQSYMVTPASRRRYTRSLRDTRYISCSSDDPNERTSDKVFEESRVSSYTTLTASAWTVSSESQVCLPRFDAKCSRASISCLRLYPTA